MKLSELNDFIGSQAVFILFLLMSDLQDPNYFSGTQEAHKSDSSSSFADFFIFWAANLKGFYAYVPDLLG